MVSLLPFAATKQPDWVSQEYRRPGLRKWPVGSYLIFYRTEGEGIEVVRVLHGSRDIDSLI